jgi:hypothetical protein
VIERKTEVLKRLGVVSMNLHQRFDINVIDERKVKVEKGVRGDWE